MKIIKESKLQEFMDISFDRVRTAGSFSDWQKQLYNFITIKLSNVLDRIFEKVNQQIENIDQDVDKEEIKATVKKAFVDYIESVF